MYRSWKKTTDEENEIPKKAWQNKSYLDGEVCLFRDIQHEKNEKELGDEEGCKYEQKKVSQLCENFIINPFYMLN